MSDNLLSGKVGLDVTNYKGGVAELNRQVRVIESGFKAAAAGMEDWDHSANGLELRMKALTGQIGLQQQKVSGLTGVYRDLAAGGKTSNRELEELQIQINKETESLNKLQVELKQTGTALDGLGKGSKETKSATSILAGTYTELNSKLDTAEMALGMVKQALKVLVGDTQAYNLEISKMALGTGAGVEETSRMVQMMDDLGIEMGTVETAMKGAATKGIALTTEELARMSDEYLKLAPGVERNTYLIDNYGKSGMELQRVMEKGGPEIRRMAAAVADNMIVTEDAAAASEKLRVSMDNLNDTITGVKNEIGNFLIPVLNDAAEAFITLVEWEERLNKAVGEQSPAVAEATDNYEDYIVQMEHLIAVSKGFKDWDSYAEAAGVMDDSYERLIKTFGVLTEEQWKNSKAAEAVAKAENSNKKIWAPLTVDIVAQEIAMQRAREAAGPLALSIEDIAKAAKAANDAMTKYNNDTLSGIDKVFNLERDHDQYMIDSSARRSALETELAALRKQGYSEQSEKIKGVRKELENLDGEIAKNQKNFDQASYAIVADLLTQQLAADGVLSNEDMDKILAYELSHGLMSQAAIDDWKQMEAEAANYQLFYLAMPDKTISITTNYRDNRPGTGSGGSGGYSDYMTGPQIPQANGGDWEVTKPTLFLAGEAGPERATFTPLSGGRNGGTTPGWIMPNLNFRAIAEMAGKAAATPDRPTPGASSRVDVGGIHITVNGGGDPAKIGQAAELGVRRALRARGAA